jgi:hypothetical protein
MEQLTQDEIILIVTSLTVALKMLGKAAPPEMEPLINKLLGAEKRVYVEIVEEE